MTASQDPGEALAALLATVGQAIETAARLDTSQSCPDENHDVVVMAMDARKTLVELRAHLLDAWRERDETKSDINTMHEERVYPNGRWLCHCEGRVGFWVANGKPCKLCGAEENKS